MTDEANRSNRTAMTPRTVTAVAVAAAALLVCGAARAEGQMSLIDLERKVAGDYRSIPHVTPEQLEMAMMTPGMLLLLDARAPEETSVSRLPGAVVIDPDISTAKFLARFGAAAKDKDVIVYCSVGVRSSKLATRVREAMLARGARRVANLQGGIFALHNTGRSLVDGNGPTDYVHPYSWWWSGYLDFGNLSRYEPR